MRNIYIYLDKYCDTCFINSYTLIDIMIEVFIYLYVYNKYNEMYLHINEGNK